MVFAMSVIYQAAKKLWHLMLKLDECTISVVIRTHKKQSNQETGKKA
jgi:hypothetical protein